MSNKVKRTMMAQQALDMSDLLNLRFKQQVVGTGEKMRLAVTTPDGPSTQGGKRARQSFTLEPADGSGKGAIMCGWLDVGQRAAELRTHRMVAAQYQNRYHTAFGVPVEEYDALLREVQSMLQAQSFQVHVADEQVAAPRASVTSAQASQGGASPAMWAALIIALVAVLGAGAYFVLGG